MEEENNVPVQEEIIEGNAENMRTEPIYDEDEMSMEGVEG